MRRVLLAAVLAAVACGKQSIGERCTSDSDCECSDPPPASGAPDCTPRLSCHTVLDPQTMQPLEYGVCAAAGDQTCMHDEECPDGLSCVAQPTLVGTQYECIQHCRPMGERAACTIMVREGEAESESESESEAEAEGQPQECLPPPEFMCNVTTSQSWRAPARSSSDCGPTAACPGTTWGCYINVGAGTAGAAYCQVPLGRKQEGDPCPNEGAGEGGAPQQEQCAPGWFCAPASVQPTPPPDRLPTCCALCRTGDPDTACPQPTDSTMYMPHKCCRVSAAVLPPELSLCLPIPDGEGCPATGL